MADSNMVPVILEDEGTLALKAKAYDMFLNKGMDEDAISVELGVKAMDISRWKAEGKWMKRRREAEQAILRRHDITFQLFQAENKIKEASDQLALGRKIQNSITDTVDAITSGGAKATPAELERLAKAAAAATSISARAVGLHDKPADPVSQEGSGGRKVPLVMIGVMPSRPSETPADAKVIDVDIDN